MKARQRINGQLLELTWHADGRQVRFQAFRQECPASPSAEKAPHIADILEVEPGIYSVLIDGRSYTVHLEHAHDGDFAQVGPWRIQMESALQPKPASAAISGGPTKVLSKMPGRVVKLLVSDGDKVAEGQGLLVLEAMKMQNEILSPRTGAVRGLSVANGDVVAAGALLCRVE